MIKTVVVTGIPATGKTTVARKIAKDLGLKYVDINKVIDEHNLCEAYDKKRKCKIVDTDKLSKILANMIKDSIKRLVLDSHLAHYLPKMYVEVCIITKCELKELKKRLEERKYSKDKVKENLDAEIFDICRVEAGEQGHYVMTIDTSKGSKDLKETIDELKEILF